MARSGGGDQSSGHFVHSEPQLLLWTQVLTHHRETGKEKEEGYGRKEGKKRSREEEGDEQGGGGEEEEKERRRRRDVERGTGRGGGRERGEES